MRTSFKSIVGNSKSTITIKKSIFIGIAQYINDKEEAQKFISEIKSKNKSAKHNVYAYVLQDGIEKCSDDGEPKGTAGKPMLELIKKLKLNNICIVVTRYFGGILLGTPGLIRAYTNIAKETIQNSEIREYVYSIKFTIEIDYDKFKEIEKEIKEFEGKIENIEYQEKMSITIIMPQKMFERFNESRKLNLEIQLKSKGYNIK